MFWNALRAWIHWNRRPPRLLPCAFLVHTSKVHVTRKSVLFLILCWKCIEKSVSLNMEIGKPVDKVHSVGIACGLTVAARDMASEQGGVTQATRDLERVVR